MDNWNEISNKYFIKIIQFKSNFNRIFKKSRLQPWGRAEGRQNCQEIGFFESGMAAPVSLKNAKKIFSNLKKNQPPLLPVPTSRVYWRNYEWRNHGKKANPPFEMEKMQKKKRSFRRMSF